MTRQTANLCNLSRTLAVGFRNKGTHSRIRLNHVLPYRRHATGRDGIRQLGAEQQGLGIREDRG